MDSDINKNRRRPSKNKKNNSRKIQEDLGKLTERCRVTFNRKSNRTQRDRERLTQE